MSKHYRMKTKGVEEPRYLLSHYLGWVEPHFEQDALFLTVCLLSVNGGVKASHVAAR